MTVDLVLCDDWELRGNGSGDMQKLQFDTLEKKLNIYEKYNLKASINAEVMQQIYHIKFATKYPHLSILKDKWEDSVCDAIKRGHDVQLHIHPQWQNASYNGTNWHLSSSWSLLEYTHNDITKMVNQCLDYLRKLTVSANNNHKIVAFRSGAWCAAPNDFLYKILSQHGINLDVSLVKDLFYDYEKLQLDYRNLEEPFLPFYPDLKDIRKLSPSHQKIICCPTYSYYLSTSNKWVDRYYRYKKKYLKMLGLYQDWREMAPNHTPIKDSKAHSTGAPWGELRTHMAPTYRIADLSALSPLNMDEMLKNIKHDFKANKKKHNVKGALPVILENHTKDIGDFGPIEYFAKKIATDRFFNVISLTELSQRLHSGYYHVRTKNSE